MVTTDNVNLVPTPQMVFVKPHPIRIFQITDEKLQAIRSAAGDSSQDLSFMMGALGIFFTALVTVFTVTLSSQAFTVIVVGIFVALAVSLYTGIHWYRNRGRLPSIIESIMKTEL